MQMWSCASNGGWPNDTDLLTPRDLRPDANPLIDRGWIEVGIHGPDLLHGATARNPKTSAGVPDDYRSAPRTVAAYISRIDNLSIRGGKHRLAKIIVSESKVPILSKMIVNSEVLNVLPSIRTLSSPRTTRQSIWRAEWIVEAVCVCTKRIKAEKQ